MHRDSRQLSNTYHKYCRTPHSPQLTGTYYLILILKSNGHRDSLTDVVKIQAQFVRV